MSEWRTRAAKVLTQIGILLWKFTRYVLFPIMSFLVRHLLIILGWSGKKLWAWGQSTLFPAVWKGYLRIPRRRRALATLVAAIVVTVTVLAPGLVPSRSASTFDEGKPLPELEAGSAAAMANAILSAESYEDASAVVMDVLAMAGIPIQGQGKPSRASSPAAAYMVLVPEAAKMTLEAQKRPTTGRVTLTQFADMLEGLGFPFDAEGMTASEQLRKFVSAWVSDARTRPDDPTSFVPLFLAESARSQLPSIDLSSDFDPDRLRLGLLDMQLFLSVFDRAVQSGQPDEQAVSLFSPNIAYAADACSEVKNWLGSEYGDKGKVAGEILQAVIGEGTGFGLKEAFETAYGELRAEQFSKMITSIGIANKLLKLATLYSQVQMDISIESDNPLQKPLADEEPKFTGFTAHAGVSDEDWKAYQNDLTSADIVRSMRDCFNVAGLPVLTDEGDLGKDAANWTVEWRLVEGSPEHGIISMVNNKFLLLGQLEMQLQQENDHMASATLVVDLTPDQAQDRSGPEQTARLTAEASLDTSSAPGLGTLINTVKGGMGDVLGITDAIVELAAGMVQTIATPKAYGTLNVTYHDNPKGNWVGTITLTSTFSRNEDIGWGDDTGTRQTTSQYSATINVTGTERRSISALDDLNFLVGTVEASFTTDMVEHYFSVEGTCESGGQNTNTSDHRISGSGRTSEPYDATLHISVAANGNGAYSIQAFPPDVSYEETNWSKNVRKTSCGTPQPSGEDSFTSQNAGSMEILELRGHIDPSDPYRVQGSNTVNKDDTTSTVKWNLTWTPDEGS